MASPSEGSAEAVELRTDPERERSFALPSGESASGEDSMCVCLGCAIGCPRCHITATNTPSCLHTSQQPAQPQQQNGF